MFSYQHITNRNEFIQKFREDQGLMPKNSRQSTAENKNKQKSDSGVNQSGLNQKGNEGRWEYLHKLEKLKRMKLEEQRKVKEKELFENDLVQCTFSPKLNTNKSLGNLSSNISQNASRIITRPKTQDKSGYNSNGNTNLPTSENVKTADNLIDRQKQWEYKKNMRIENIKQSQFVKDTRECIFTPKLVKIFFNYFKKIELA